MSTSIVCQSSDVKFDEPCLSSLRSVAFESSVVIMSKYGGTSTRHQTLWNVFIPTSIALKEVHKAKDLNMP